ncbi:hypothetical protein A3Q56_03760 [Intoshia linei]|uniref:Uncharacterized protein n=1 Tax=Intoshia linei TaxID=1819745 RepID=A0A177B521_9BILA|nr:hypothetical protein A3Q56_03760 [Intoshia linei]
MDQINYFTEDSVSELECYLLNQQEKESNMIDLCSNNLNMESSQRLKLLFQQTAENLSNLYLSLTENKRNASHQNYLMFKNCSDSVTKLYKENVDYLKKVYESGCRRGGNIAKRDLLHWINLKKRHVKREDLIKQIVKKSVCDDNMYSISSNRKYFNANLPFNSETHEDIQNLKPYDISSEVKLRRKRGKPRKNSSSPSNKRRRDFN